MNALVVWQPMRLTMAEYLVFDYALSIGDLERANNILVGVITRALMIPPIFFAMTPVSPRQSDSH